MPKRHPENERLKRRYFQWLSTAKGASDKTIDQVAAALNSFEEITNRKDFKKFHPEWALKFRRKLHEAKSKETGKPLSISTVRARLRDVKDFFKWLADQPGYKSRIRHSDCEYFNLTANETRAATAHRESRPPTIDQIKVVIETAPAITPVERRDRALMAFTLLSGMRDAAIGSLTLGAVDLKKRRIEQDARHVKTKNAKTMVTYFFPVGQFFEEVVGDWIHFLRRDLGCGDDHPLFPKTLVGRGPSGGFGVIGLSRECWRTTTPIRRIFKAMFEAADLPYFNPHSFRNTLTQLAYSLELGLEASKAWSQNLGHEKPATTWTSYGRVESGRTAEILAQLSEEVGHPRKQESVEDLIAKLARHPSITKK